MVPRMSGWVILLLALAIAPAHAGLVPPDIPDGSRVGHLRAPRPPDGFTSAIGWIDAIHDWRDFPGTTSLIEVRKAELWACVNGQDVLLTSGITRDDGTITGGLYSRGIPYGAIATCDTCCPFCMPWYWGADADIKFPNTYAGGIASFSPSKAMNMIWHAWNNKWPRVTLPPGTQTVYFKVEARITGHALFRAGFDWYRDSITTDTAHDLIEGGAADWRFASAGWETLNVGLPCSKISGVPATPPSFRISLVPRPNPSREETTMEYVLPEGGAATLRVYDVSGRCLATLSRGTEGPGLHAFRWEQCDERGRKLPAGLYLVQLRVGELETSRQLVLTR